MECINPTFVKRLGSSVRCGRCPACREYSQRSWAVRLHAELQRAETAYFITLTYNDEAVINCDWGFPDEDVQYPWQEAIKIQGFPKMVPKLTKSHLTLFLKRLNDYNRRGIPNYLRTDYPSLKRLKMTSTVKHFAVGEYGTKKDRPHWHLLLFNYPFSHSDMSILLKEAWVFDDEGVKKSQGFSHCGIIRGGSIDYVSNYLLKNEKDEVRFISRGLGLAYLTPNIVKYHQKSLDGVCRIDGSRQVMPRYLKKRIFTQREQKVISDKHFNAMMDSKEQNPKLLHEQFNYLEQKIKLKLSKK